MSTAPDARILELFEIELPIIQAPMAGATTPEMVIAVSDAGGLGSLPSAMYSPEQLRAALAVVVESARRSFNLNFFCHREPAPDPVRQRAWRARLEPYYHEAGLALDASLVATGRAPFNDELCSIVEAYRPRVVSFHFGLPEASLLDRVKATGAKVISSATTVAEARWLVEHGVHAVIAMGAEAGGHRGNFLTHDMATQVGTLALVPQIVDAVAVPVIAAGGIADARGVAAALALGAAAAQVGTAYLLTPEAKISPLHRRALMSSTAQETAITNVFTGRPARSIVNRLMREVGPLSDLAPEFPTAGAALAPLRAKDEAGDFTNLWSGQAAPLARAMSAAELTRALAMRIPADWTR